MNEWSGPGYIELPTNLGLGGMHTGVVGRLGHPTMLLYFLEAQLSGLSLVRWPCFLKMFRNLVSLMFVVALGAPSHRKGKQR